MKCLLTSVNYGDYLAATAEYSSKFFEEVVVVTIKSDKETIEVCNDYKNYTCITVPDSAPSYSINKNKTAKFNKGHLLNYGFKYLESKKYKGYICCTDGDTTFSPGFLLEFSNWQNKLKTALPEVDLSKILFGLPRYMVQDLKGLKKLMLNPDVKCKRNKNGKWIGLNHPISRIDNETHERILLGYCQIYYIDTEEKTKPHKNANKPFYFQSEQFNTTMGLDTKLIGNFRCSLNRLNLVRKSDAINVGNIMHDSGKGTCKPGFNFEGLPKKGGKLHLYGCHIEDPSLFCVHIGPNFINAKGRKSKRIK